MTTWPLYWASDSGLPARESRVKSGAALFCASPASAAAHSSTPAAKNPAIRCVMSEASLKEHGHADHALEIARQLVRAEQIRVEHVRLQAHVQRQPVRRQHAVSTAEIQGDVIIAREPRVTEGCRNVQ